jgi:hypothetical protein
LLMRLWRAFLFHWEFSGLHAVQWLMVLSR